MYVEVYVDVIFIINFIMDIILLLIVKKILKCSSSKIRLICGAGIGALGACILAVFPNLNGLIQFLITYVILCFAMIAIAFRQNKWQARIKAVVILYITTFFLGGVLNSLYYQSKLGYYFKELIQGRLFQNRNMTYLVLEIFVGTAALFLLTVTLKSLRGGTTETYQTELSYGDKSHKIIGLLDTGNNLFDPIYGKPVIITEYSVIETLLTENQKNQLRKTLDMLIGNLNRNSEDCFYTAGSQNELLNILMIPYHSIGKKNGLLPAIIVDKITIWNGEEQICNEKVVTAISIDKVSDKDTYQVILHKKLL